MASTGAASLPAGGGSDSNVGGTGGSGGGGVEAASGAPPVDVVGAQAARDVVDAVDEVIQRGRDDRSVGGGSVGSVGSGDDPEMRFGTKPRSFSDSDMLQRAGRLLPYTSPVVKRTLLAARSDMDHRRNLLMKLNVGKKALPIASARRRSLSGRDRRSRALAAAVDDALDDSGTEDGEAAPSKQAADSASRGAGAPLVRSSTISHLDRREKPTAAFGAAPSRLVKDSASMRRQLIMRLQGPPGARPTGPTDADVAEKAARRKARLERRRAQREKEAADRRRELQRSTSESATPAAHQDAPSLARAKSDGTPAAGEEAEGVSGFLSSDDDREVAQTAIRRSRDELALGNFLTPPSGTRGRLSKDDLSGIGAGDERWVDSDTVKVCQQCETTFTVLNRKHHCRACGLVVCGDCSPYKQFLVALQATVRVCRECNAILLGSVWDRKPDSEAFFDAIDRGDIIEIESRIQDGQELDVIDRVTGEGPLHVAARAGTAEAARVLIKAGSPIDLVTPEGRSALHVAAQTGILGALAPLLKAGADPEKEDNVGDTPRSLAIKYGHRKVLAKFQALDPPSPSPPPMVFTQSPGPASRKVVMSDSRIKELEPEFAVLEPAGKALQLNLRAVLDEELRWVNERKWQQEMVQGTSMQDRFEQAGLIKAVDRNALSEASGFIVGNAWNVGHLFGAEIDLADAVQAVAQGIKLAEFVSAADPGGASASSEEDESD